MSILESNLVKKLFIKSLKFLTKRDTPASFKCNLLTLRCLLGLIFLCDIMPILFALHNSFKIILTSSSFFLFSSSRGTTLETITVLLSNLSELVLYSLPCQSSLPKGKVLLSQYIFDC